MHIVSVSYFIDIILEGLEEAIYIFELKFKSSAEAAIKQLKSRSYCRDYLEKSKKQVIAVGLNYTPKKGVTALFQTIGLRGKKPDYHLAYRFPPKIGTKGFSKTSHS